MNVFLDNAATTPLNAEAKDCIINLLDNYYNPSSKYQNGMNARKIIENARENVAQFISGRSENVIFTSSGSAANSLIIKGLTSEDRVKNEYFVFYSPTSHKSMIEACKSCCVKKALAVDEYGRLDLGKLKTYLQKTFSGYKPLVCIEAANSEIGTINDIPLICDIVHNNGGIVIADVTGYIPTNMVNINELKADFITFSGHKLGALKGIGALYINKKLFIKPLVYGTQERSLFAGTENLLGIASLGAAVCNYKYNSVSSKNRDYVYDYIMHNIPNSVLIGAPLEYRLPHNLYMCFIGVHGEQLMTLLDINGIEVSTGSACNSGNVDVSPTLAAINMDKQLMRSCIRMTFLGKETKKELDYVCAKLKECVERLRKFID